MWLNMWFHANLCMSKSPDGERNYSVAKILKTKSGHENNIMKLRQQAFPIFFHTL